MTNRARRAVAVAAATLAIAVAALAAPRPSRAAADGALAGETAADVAAARALFERNLQAIRDRDRAAYLACYLDSPGLVRTGPGGPTLGFDALAASAGQEWPDHIEAEVMRLVPIRPGFVYGTYRYRVRYGATEDAGLSERFFVATPQGWRIAISTAFSALPGVPPPPRALLGATLVDGTGAAPVADTVVVLRGGEIECAGPRASCAVPSGVEVTDLRGLWLTPGLVDAHVHFSQTGWADGRPDALDQRAEHPYEQVEADLERHPERFGRSYLCSGVTAVYDVGGYPWTLRLPAWAEPLADQPRIAAAGPLLSTLDFWLNLPATRQFIHLADAAAGRSGVEYLSAAGSRAVKVWYIVTPQQSVGSSAAAVRAAGEEARLRRLPLVVHATGLAEAKEALRAGAKLLVHSVWDLPVDDEFLALARGNGTIYCPTLTVARGYQRLFEAAIARRAPTVDDPNRCVDPATLAKVASTAGLTLSAADTARLSPEYLARYRERLASREHTAADNLKRIAAAGIPIAMGTDAGNPLTLHGPAVYAELEAMRAAGLTPMQVLVAATRDAALAMGRDRDFGTVERGKRADLLVLGADPVADAAAFRQVRFVVRGGVLRSQAELSALATTPAAAPGP